MLLVGCKRGQVRQDSFPSCYVSLVRVLRVQTLNQDSLGSRQTACRVSQAHALPAVIHSDDVCHCAPALIVLQAHLRGTLIPVICEKRASSASTLCVNLCPAY